MKIVKIKKEDLVPGLRAVFLNCDHLERKYVETEIKRGFDIYLNDKYVKGYTGYLWPTYNIKYIFTTESELYRVNCKLKDILY